MSTAPDIPEALLREVCSRHRIARDDEFLVLKAIREPGAPAACCGSDCEPCILDIEAAEQEIRKRLDLL